MFETALRYPWNDGDGVKSLLIGAVLSLLGFLIVPTILVAGYTLRVLATVRADPDAPLPEWDEWGDMLVDGLKAFVVSLVYGIGPLLLLGALVAAVFVPVVGSVPRVTSILFVLLAVLALGLTIVGLYALPAALVRLATTGRIGAAFAVGPMWSLLSSGSYLTGWLYALAITLVAGIVGSILAATFVGGILTPVVVWYGTLAAAYCYARGSADVLDVEARSDDRIDEQVA